MTDARKEQKPLSRRALRASAWVAGGAAFLSPLVALGLAPKPTESAAASTPSVQPRQVVIVRKITRRVIVREAPKKSPVHYVYAGGTSNSGTSSGGGTSASAPTTTGTGGSGGG